MRKFNLSLSVLVLGAATVLAQHVVNVQADEVEVPAGDQSGKGLLDIEFTLDPVELALSDELADAKRHYESGEWQKAIQLATKFLEKNPHHKQLASAYFIRGESYAQQKQYRETRKNFREVLKHDPSPVQRTRAEFRIAEAAMLSGQYLEARKLMEDFRRRYPDDNLNAYVLVYLGEIVGRETPAAAKPIFVASLQRYPGGPMSRRA